MFSRVTFAISLLLLAICGGWATTYYSRSSGQWNTTTRWNTVRDGSGSSHDATWTGNHIYYIQSGHAITRPGIALGSSGSSLVIEDGGSYTHGASGGNLTFGLVRIESNATFTANATGHAYTTLTIYGGGKYIHNTGSNAIPGSTRNFANSTNGGNGHGTVEIKNQGTSGISSGITWGNVIINNTSTTQALGNAGAFANVEGDFKVINTNGYDYRFMSNQTTTHNIAGDLLIEGGTLVFKSDANSAIVNVGKGVKITGGTLALVNASSGSIEMNVKEDLVVDAGSFLATSGPNVSCVMNLEGALKVIGSANFRAYNGGTSGSGYLKINFSNTQSLNRSSELKLRTGYDRYACKWDINVKSGRTITLGSDVEIGTTNNSGYPNNTFTIENGGSLDCGTYIIKIGSGIYNSGYEPRFSLSSGGSFSTANTAGITSSGASGSIQVTGTRTYNSGANYTYNGTSAQVTGNGLTSANNLIINNSAGVTLSAGVTASGNLTLTNGALNLNSNTLTVNGTTTVTGGSFASGSTPTTDGYSNSNAYLSIAANDVNVSSFSASTSVVEGNYPLKIKRQWSISGNSGGNNKAITFSWTADDDVNFNWSGKVPSVFSGSTEYAGDASGNSYNVSGAIRTITILAPISASKADWNIGIKGGSETLPIELSSFTASISAWGTVQLIWVTQSETNVLGFRVLRGDNTDLSAAVVISSLITATNTSTLQSYVYQDMDPGPDGQRYYWLQHVEMDGSEAFHGPVAIDYYTTGQEGSPTPPLRTGFHSVYPNPFNPSLNISYQLSAPANVRINVYNQRGQKVKSFSLGNKDTGRHSLSWSARSENESFCGSGLYLIELLAGDERHTTKATLLK